MTTRPFLALAASVVLLAAASRAQAVNPNEIITQSAAEHVGLTRAWVTQVQLDRGRTQVRDVVLYDGTLYIVTSNSTLEAIDAESGQKLWATLVGSPQHPTVTPSVYRDLIATVNGSTLYVLNRYNGQKLYQTDVNGAVGGGPALTSKRAYVPMTTGMIMAYRIEPLVDPAKELGKYEDPDKLNNMSDEEKAAAAKAAEDTRRENIRINKDYVPPLACQSAGRALVAPLPTFASNEEEFVAWTTDRGYLYIGYIDRRSDEGFQIKHRLTTDKPIYCRPAYLPPNPKIVGDMGTVFGASEDGYVYALAERSGELLWRFSTGEAIVDSPVVLDDRVYVTTVLGGIYCIDINNGKLIWNAPEVVHFVASSKQRVYGYDRQSRLRILDGRNGSLVDMLNTQSLPIIVSNDRTDRIFLASQTGTIECLHEVEATNPIAFNDVRWKAMLAGDKEQQAVLPLLKRSGPARADKEVATKAADKGDAAGADADSNPLATPEPKKMPAPKAAGKAAKPAADPDNPFGQ